MAEFANIGLTGSLIGTNLRMALTFLTRETEKSTKAFARMIPTLETANSLGNDFRLTMQDLSPETNNLADIVRKLAQVQLTAADAIDIFGRRSGAAIKNLVDRYKTGAVDIQAFTAAILEATETGLIEERFTRMQATLSARIKILKSAIVSGDARRIGESLFNDLESICFERFPVLAEIKKGLQTLGACGALMSGSGSSVFGLFPDNTEAQRACRSIKKSGREDQEVFLCRTILK